MKYLTYTNLGCTQICHNMVKSLLQCNVAPEDIFIKTLDEESTKYFREHLPQVTNVEMFLDVGLKGYQDWSFDPSSKFCELVSWKWKMIRTFYLIHKEFVFTDSDIVFVKNPNKRLMESTKDFAIQGDSPGSKYCTGFMYFRKNSTCDMITKYCSSMHSDDQLSLNGYLARSPELEKWVDLLPQEEFPNGAHFHRGGISKSNPYMVHNNHMVGIETKINAFKKEGLWLI